jgi:hypothetical protein
MEWSFKAIFFVCKYLNAQQYQASNVAANYSITLSNFSALSTSYIRNAAGSTVQV